MIFEEKTTAFRSSLIESIVRSAGEYVSGRERECVCVCKNVVVVFVCDMCIGAR